MHFFDLPPELRLQIYSELLVLPEPTVFVVDFGPWVPPPRRRKRYGLCPALLRINKKVYSEANAMLYSDNQFLFLDIITNTSSATDSTYLASFLDQIGSRAAQFRHITIPCPTFEDLPSHRVRLDEADVENLKLVRDTCTNIKTIELYVSYTLITHLCDYLPIAAEALHFLDTQFKNIPSLKEVVINFEVNYDEDPSDNLTKTMHDYGWAVKVTRLPKSTWISADDRLEFDNPDDCSVYDDEQFGLEEQRR